MKSHRILIAAATAVTLGLAAGSAAAQTVNVAGTANPWDPTVAGNNSIDTEGSTGPAIVAVNAGDHITINYLSGFTNAFSATDPPIVDANGYVGDIFGSGAPFLSDPSDPSSPLVSPTGIGSSDFPLPSFYADPTNVGPDVWLNELLGVFADSSGLTIGDAFAIGDDPFSIIAPTGATRLQLGVNDDIFTDNDGSLLVQVLGSTVSATGGIPEPATWGLMITGFGLAGATLRRRRRLAVTA
jgi:hypothetical protein